MDCCHPSFPCCSINPHHWLFHAWVQGSRRSTASEEKQVWCQWPELQICIELTMCHETAGEGCSSFYPGLLRQQWIDAKDAVCILAIPQHRKGSKESVQRPNGSRWRQQDVSPVNRSLRHGWPPAALIPLGAIVRITWRCAGLVQITSVRQNVPCCVQWLDVVHCLHHLLSTPRLSAGSTAVHCVHCGSCRHCRSTRCILTCLRWWHCIYTVVATTWRQLPPGCASQKLANGWPPIASSTMQIRPSCWVPGQKTITAITARPFSPSVTTGPDLITPRDHVQLLGATISSDLKSRPTCFQYQFFHFLLVGMSGDHWTRSQLY